MLVRAIERQSPTNLVVMVGLLVGLTLGAITFDQLLVRAYREDTQRIELAGRQRQLSQQIAKAAFLLEDAPGAAGGSAARDELLAASAQFEHALQALRFGGRAYLGDTDSAAIEPLADAGPRQQLARLDAAWQPVAEALAPLRSADGVEAAAALARLLRAQNLTVLEQSRRLLADTRNASEKRLRRLYLARFMCFLLALFDSLALLFVTLHQLRMARGGTRQRQIMETVSAGICLVEANGRIVVANSAAATLFGRSSDSLEGEHLPETDPDGRIEYVTPAGKRVLAQVTRKPLPPPSVLDVVTLQDITDHVEHAEALDALAHHDALTGLPNRRLFEDRIAVAIAQATRVRQRVGVAIVDLDRFKPVNDTLGHAAGDAVLQAVAQRLAACARAGDTVARLGGDEFVCVFTGIGGREHLAALGQRLLDSLATPIEYEGRFLPLPASIGLGIFPDDAEETADLLARADSAMYQAKQQGGNCVMAYSD